MEDISNLCRMFMDIVKGHAEYEHFEEAMHVVGEAAEAVREGNNQNLVDCAYHLEDFLDRLNQ